MIMVNPLGYGHAGGGQGATDMIVHFTDQLLNEVMPRVEKEFNVAKDRDRISAITAGLSPWEARKSHVRGPESSGQVCLHRGPFGGACVACHGREQNASRGGPGGPPPAGASGGMGAFRLIRPRPAFAAGASGGRGGGGRGRQSLNPAIIDNNFGTLSAKINPEVEVAVDCLRHCTDTYSSVNRQFKDWLTAKNVKFTQQEVSGDAAHPHLQPLWRQNLADLVADQLSQAR